MASIPNLLIVIALAAAGAPGADGGRSNKSIPVEVVNQGSTIREPVLTLTPGALREHRAKFRADGLPNIVEIAVPEGAATLSLKVRSERPAIDKLELYLYDCTTGECFSYDIKFPAAPEHTLVVRKPNAGRWVAAVNAAPFPTSPGRFVLEEVLTKGSAQEQRSARPLLHGERWTTTVDPSAIPSSAGDAQPILFVELLDATIEKDEAAYPWDPSPKAYKLRDRPVALGTAIVRR
jgi:hypothetical protein